MLAIFLDIESTGLDSFRHSPIDIALKVIDITTGEEKGRYQSLIRLSPEAWERRDPGSMLINGYLFEELQVGKDILQVKEDILALFQKLNITRGLAVYICQNPGFDRGFFAQIIDVYTQEKLNWPYHWLDFASMYWALLSKKVQTEHAPFPISLNLSKNEIAKAYNLPAEISPHKGMNGVDHLIMCYKAVVGLEDSFGTKQ